MLPELLILLRPPRGQGRAVLSGWAEGGLGCRRGFGLQLTQHWDLSDLVIVEPENVSCTLWLQMSTKLTVCAVAVV